MAMDRKKPSVPSDGRAKETSEVRNKWKSMTCGWRIWLFRLPQGM
jgi:hypothetical protein